MYFWIGPILDIRFFVVYYFPNHYPNRSSSTFQPSQDHKFYLLTFIYLLIFITLFTYIYLSTFVCLSIYLFIHFIYLITYIYLVKLART